MSHKTYWLIAVALFLFVSRDSRAQDPTSRLIPFSLSTSLPPGTTQEVTVELWGAASDGGPVFSEAYAGPDAVAVDDGGKARSVLRVGALWHLVCQKVISRRVQCEQYHRCR